MKRSVSVIAVIGIFFLVGCATTQELTSSISSKVTSITATVDPALVNQVPADKRAGFAKAEFDLNLAIEKEKLAALKTELAGLQKKKAGYEEDLANNFKREAENAYDIVKVDALLNAGVGKKEDNMKIRGNVDSKKYKILADRSKINYDISDTKMQIENKTAEIANLEKAIGEIKYDGGKASDKASVSPAPAADAKTEVKPVPAAAEPKKEEKK
ncbi:MAG TPA: hypothetical protein PKZ12_00755 [Smithellaceae bacterium]|nr:hypothetical protein [Smithellaceae bacterium]